MAAKAAGVQERLSGFASAVGLRLSLAYSPSAATCGSYMHTHRRRPNHKRASRNHMAYPEGEFTGQIIIQEQT